MSIVDNILAVNQEHVAYLKALFAEMKAAGFDRIRIHDDDLSPLEVDVDGADAVIREMFELDDYVLLLADWPRHAGDIPPYDEPYRMQLMFVLCNDAHECLADYSIPCQSADEAITAIVDNLADNHTP